VWVGEIPAPVNVAHAIATVEEVAEDEGSVSAASKLSAPERIFCDVFMANGAKATEAAIAAGYPEASASVQACRLLCRKRVADYIIASCERLIQTALPVAIRALIEIASDKDALRKDRIKAATSLLEHGGMAAPKGGVQVNVGVAVNGQQAQQLIGEVWEAKARRLSDIPPAMPDTLQRDLADIEAAALPAPADTPGGDQLQGPVGGGCPLPPPSSANSPISRVSWPSGDGFCECADCRAMMGREQSVADGFEAFKKAEGED
jgi:phage terminase small subunit